MPLPELIEIVPLTKPVQAQITVPGSKSITNRALILAALAQGKTTLQGALWSEDTQVMVDCLRKLGFAVEVTPDPEEFCNRTITVDGLGGKIPNFGTPEKPLELFVGNAGTAARFLSALCCLGYGVYRLHGVSRMHERPQAALFEALRELGYRIDSENENDKLPARIYGGGESPSRRSRGDEALTSKSEENQSLLTSAPTNKPLRSCSVSIQESSQFASALLLCAKIGGWEVKVVGHNAEESPYVAMTLKLIEAFPKTGGSFRIEPDASSGSYFWGAGWLLTLGFFQKLIKMPKESMVEQMRQKTRIRVSNWPDSGWQLDAEFTVFITPGTESVPIEFSRKHDLADSIMTAIVLAPLATIAVSRINFTDLGRLRVQECERVVALRTELTKCGANVIEKGDTLEVFPSQLHGAEIETYNDHRMAMCFSILGLKVPGMKIRNPACVKKTFPNFFQKLAAVPPAGLGATILDAKTGQQLSHDELFAD